MKLFKRRDGAPQQHFQNKKGWRYYWWQRKKWANQGYEDNPNKVNEIKKIAEYYYDYSSTKLIEWE